MRLQRVLGSSGDLSGHFNTGKDSPDNGGLSVAWPAVPGSLDRSATEKRSICGRNSNASSMDFMPGANSAKWSLPK